MQIVVSADIGEVGPTDGKAVTCHFSPLYRVQGIIPWLLLPLAFVALKENRTPEAAWILVPIALLGLIYSAVMRIFQVTSGSTVQLNVIFAIIVVGFSLIWLSAERIGNRNRFVTFLLATLIYFGFLGVNLLSRGFGKDMIAIASLAAVSIPAIIFAFIIAVLSSSKTFNAVRFVIYVGAALFGSLLIILLAVVFIFYPPQNVPVTARITEALIASVFCSLIYYAGLLPFLVMLFADPFWRRRFEAVSGIQTRIAIEPPPQMKIP
ncbi:MAG: hypothetical protein ISS70_04650 [Phycisphaerae bacterium]|nr:hypothetical protein [Phycisphaerae bacterium]